MKVAVVQHKSVLGDFEANLERTVEFIKKAIEQGADICLFPELNLTGYNVQDITSEIAVTAERLAESPLSALSEKISFIVGAVEESEEHIFYNSAFCFSKGKLIHVHRKIFLPTYGMFDEGRFTGAGKEVKTFCFNGIKSVALICEDLWHFSTVYLAFIQGSKFIFALSSSPGRGYRESGEFENAEIWRNVGEFYSRMTGSYFFYTNRVGVEDGFVFSGKSFVCDPFGNVIAEASSFKEEMLLVTVNPALIRAARVSLPLLRDEKPEIIFSNLRRILDER